MALSHEDSASGSEDDAPETISLAQSKQSIKKGDDALQRAHAAEKVKKKLQNKEKDRRLKAQAENSKRKWKERNDGDVNLLARMERAMQEATEEMDDDGDLDEDGHDSHDDGEEFKGIDDDSDDDSGKGSDDLDADSEEEDEAMDSGEEATPKTNPNHLPDHLFTSAFASTNTKTISKRKAKEDPVTRSKPRKRVRSNAAPKDVLIGSRTIRTLSSGAIAGASTLPTPKVRKFLDRSLGLKGSGSKKRGWERRPVNLGVMKRNGPAANFVRSR